MLSHIGVSGVIGEIKVLSIEQFWSEVVGQCKIAELF